jgi:hypothetical protein
VVVFAFMEIWKTIKDFENYEVSNYGIIKRKTDGYIVKQYIVQGYLKVNLVGVKRKSIFVHRIISIAFLKNKNKHKDKTQVNHIDGNKVNNSLSNLEWCTPSENIQHSFNILKKQVKKGEKCNLSKLKEKDIKFIRNNKNIYTSKQLQLMFNTSQSNICNIINNKRWKHI